MSTYRNSKRVTAQATQLAMAVPQVVAHRVARMMTAGANPSASDQAEFQRMGTEKVVAFGESWMAMGAQMLRAQQSLANSMVSVWSQPWNPGSATTLMRSTEELQNAALGVLGSGLAPVHRRAVDNARRLGTTRSRKA